MRAAFFGFQRATKKEAVGVTRHRLTRGIAAEAFEGRGFMSALFAAALDVAKTRSLRQVTLNTFPERRWGFGEPVFWRGENGW